METKELLTTETQGERIKTHYFNKYMWTFKKSNLRVRLSDWAKQSKSQLLVKNKRICQTKFPGKAERSEQRHPGKVNKKKAGVVILISDKAESKIK